MPEYQRIVEEDVHHRHHQRGDRDDLGVGEAHVERTEQEVHTDEDNTPLAEVHELERRSIYGRGLYDMVEKGFRAEIQHGQQAHPKHQRKIEPMFKNGSYLMQISLSQTTRHHDLHTHGEALRNGREHQIVKAGHHRSTQFGIAHVSQEYRIHKHNDGLCQIPENDGVRYLPNLLMGHR